MPSDNAAPSCRDRDPSAVEHGSLLYDEAGLAQVIVNKSAVLAVLFGEPDAAR